MRTSRAPVCLRFWSGCVLQTSRRARAASWTRPRLPANRHWPPLLRSRAPAQVLHRAVFTKTHQQASTDSLDCKLVLHRWRTKEGSHLQLEATERHSKIKKTMRSVCSSTRARCTRHTKCLCHTHWASSRHPTRATTFSSRPSHVVSPLCALVFFCSFWLMNIEWLMNILNE